MLHGLEHRSVESILDWLAADGFNAIRLPFSLRMALHLDEKLKAYKDGKQVTARELIKASQRIL
jgi:aryl-phospho-beta-D-glucosidase BglC (GH1 family)